MAAHECMVYYRSPIGILEITGTDQGVTTIYFLNADPDRLADVPTPPVLTCLNQLNEYFNGERKEFSVPLQLAGTAFQMRVWQHLLTIPFGVTRSYLSVAEALGDRNTVRAVGTANGQNPISIIVPCHRVIGSNGSLTGYGGGLWRKEWLLNHEGHANQPRLF
jgi:methylated-DNA-[protein]-cysteine S-methyltransferase